MANLMLRIEQHDADRIERIGFAQAFDHGAQQLRQAVGAQQRQLARLRALEDAFVVGGLGGQLGQTLLERLIFLDDIVHTLAATFNPRALGPARRNRLVLDS